MNNMYDEDGPLLPTSADISISEKSLDSLSALNIKSSFEEDSSGTSGTIPESRKLNPEKSPNETKTMSCSENSYFSINRDLIAKELLYIITTYMVKSSNIDGAVEALIKLIDTNKSR